MTESLRRIRTIAILSGAALAAFFIGYVVLSSMGGTVEITDRALEEAVRASIGRESGPLQQQELERITHLDAAGYPVRDLESIVVLRNLRTLDLSETPASSLAPLRELNGLEELRLRDAGLTSVDDRDLATLSVMPVLQRLVLERNEQLRDIAGLAQFRSLRELSLRATPVRDLAPLADLTTLRILDLRETDLGGSNLNAITGLGALEHLNLRESGVTDIEALEHLPGLRYLNLHSNTGIVSLEPLRSLRRLQTLILRNVPVEDQLPVISRMPGLQRLNIRNTGVRDLEVLASLMSRGALQDDPNGGITAEVDIRDNPIPGDARRGPYGYDVLLPYWNRISRRFPEELPRAPTGDVLINEVMTSNGTVLRDAAGAYPDWIELRNPGEVVVDLSEAILAPGEPHDVSWRFPAGTLIRPGEYLVVYASGRGAPTTGRGGTNSEEPEEREEAEERHQPEERVARAVPAERTEIHTDFTLSSGGTDLVLLEPDGRTVIDQVRVPAIPRDTSWGRDADDRWVTFHAPTPGESNRGASRHLFVQFSHAPGFHRDPFALELDATFLRSPGDADGTSNAAASNAAIYFTLDGSEPDPTAPGGVRTYTYRDHATGETVERASRTYRYAGPIPILESSYLLNRHGPDPIDPVRVDRSTGPLAWLSTTVPEADFWYWKPPEHRGFRAIVVRATAYDGHNRGGVYSATFFVDPEIDEQFSMGIVAITADPAALFGFEEGVYVPGRIYEEHRHEEERWMRRPANYGERWEVPAHIEFYEPDGYRGVAVDGGLRVHGGWSRSQPLKSLRLYARKDYHRVNYFEYPFFHDLTDENTHRAITAHKRLMLRSGQSLFRSHLQDAVAHAHVAPHVAVDLMEYRPVVHFINGEYWGIKNLRERFDRFYLEARYGLDPEEVIVIDGPMALDHHLAEGRPGEAEQFRELIRYVENNDPAQDRHREYLESIADLDSFIDYNIVRIFSGDADGVTKHVAMWRRRGEVDPDAPPGLDGRWRWHTWDFDNAFMFLENDTMTFYGNDRTDEEYVRMYLDQQQEEEIDPELLGDSAALRSAAGMTTRHPRYTILFTRLLRNREFRNRFLNRFNDLMNTVYRPEVLITAIEEAAGLLEPEIGRHIQRWGYPASEWYWRTQVDRNIEYARSRPEIQRRQIAEYFRERGVETGNPVTVVVHSPQEGGAVRVNTVVITPETPGVDARGPWEGVYFSGVPIELEAIPRDGYRFDRWDGPVPENQREDPVITQAIRTRTELKPRFVPEKL